MNPQPDLAELSPAEQFALLPMVEQQQFLSTLTKDELQCLDYTWDGWWARPKQVMPKDPATWLYVVLSGRGWGKTRTSAEWLLDLVQSGEHDWIALVGTDYASLCKVNIEGPSGILRACPPWLTPRYVKTPKPELRFANGVRITGYSAEDPEGLRGFSGTAAACDELCAWRYMRETWEMLMFGLREGANPVCLVTTTPKPQKLLRELIKDPGAHVVRGHTRENSHLNADRVQKLMSDYGDSRLGRQELDGEILDDDHGLFKGSVIDLHRLRFDPAKLGEQRQAVIDDLDEVVVAIDPSSKGRDGSDACGIVVCGKKVEGSTTHYYVIEDCTEKLSPKAWAEKAVQLFRSYQAASYIVVETNMGGQMAIDSITNVWDSAPIKPIHACKGKAARAEPISVLMETGKVHHMGVLAELEEELTGWEPGKGMASPNRLDAYVYALLQLSGGGISWCFDPATWDYMQGKTE